jgi:hypothetical protein
MICRADLVLLDVKKFKGPWVPNLTKPELLKKHGVFERCRITIESWEARIDPSDACARAAPKCCAKTARLKINGEVVGMVVLPRRTRWPSSGKCLFVPKSLTTSRAYDRRAERPRRGILFLDGEA